MTGGIDYRMRETCVSFGRFDGVHRGHKAVLERMAHESAQDGLQPVVLSLAPSGTDGREVLSTEAEKWHVMREHGVHAILSVEEQAVRTMEPEEFVRRVLLEQMDARTVVAGEDCRFGAGGAGDLDCLRRLSERFGFRLAVVERQTRRGEPVTDERIKHCLERCDLEEANALLDHPYFLIGEVVTGKQLGRTVGMPTANLGIPPNKIEGAHGVYATLSHLGGESLPGLTNIGRRPSVDDGEHVTVETHLLNFDRNIYGEKVVLELHHYIRGVVKFNNLEEVKLQVERDLEQTREHLMRA